MGSWKLESSMHLDTSGFLFIPRDSLGVPEMVKAVGRVRRRSSDCMLTNGGVTLCNCKPHRQLPPLRCTLMALGTCVCGKDMIQGLPPRCSSLDPIPAFLTQISGHKPPLKVPGRLKVGCLMLHDRFPNININDSYRL
jgi:hypothetical protein